MRIHAIGKPPGSKLLRIDADAEKESGAWVLASFRVRGDFFAIPEEGYEEAEARLSRIRLDELAERFDDAMEASGVSLSGISGTAVQAILEEALGGN